MRSRTRSVTDQPKAELVQVSVTVHPSISVKLRKSNKQPAGRVYGFTMKGYLRTPVLSEPTQEANLVPLREQLSAMPETLANEVSLVRRYAERGPGM